MEIVVNMGDAKCSMRSSDTLITYSLGSCIGVSVYDATTRIGGMLHCQLPCGSTDGCAAGQSPLAFADTGMELLLKWLIQAGASEKRLVIKLAGAAQMLSNSDKFDIGRRNHAAIRKYIWRRGLFIAAEDIGGASSRHMSLDLAEGTVLIKKQGQAFPL